MAGLDIAVWVASGILAAIYLMVGGMKLLQPAKAQQMGPVLEALSPGMLRSIGAFEVLGAIGVILPAALGIVPWLSGVAAIGLGLIQVLAIPRHIKHQDTKALPMNFLLLALAAFVALVRTGAVP